jgi:hypothetical protein
MKTSGHVRSERVNKWPNPMTYVRIYDDDDDDDKYRKGKTFFLLVSF